MARIDASPPRARRHGSIPLIVLAILCAAAAGCGGDSGVGDGRIQGTVLAPRSGASGISPVAGVSVTAERTEGTRIQRSATTDAFGHYQFTKLPTGPYQLTFFANGFQQAVSSRSLSVFVEPDGVSQVPDVILTAVISSGTAVVLVNLVDAVTGEAVNGATVAVGSVSASFGSNGTYSLVVPVSPDSNGQPASQRILVSGEGHLPGTEQPGTLTPIAGQTLTVTVRIQPAQTTVQGVVRAASFDDLYRASGTYGRISITSDSIDPGFLSPTLDPGSGRFSVRVPGSSSTNTRRFGLIFSGQGFFLKILSGLLAPRAGATANLSSDVLLDPVTTTLEGNVITSSGSLPGGAFDQVALVELGQVAAIVNGAFFFARAPVAIPLTLRATAINPFRPGFPEIGSLRVTPADNGSGRFAVGAIQTR